ncbi:transposase [Deinococcus radiopugnans]
MVTARSVNQSDLCAHLPGMSSIEAKKRRVERGCRDPQLTESVFLAFLLALLPPGNCCSAWTAPSWAERTPMRTPARTWERGDAPLNLLVLGVVLHGYTVPLVWTALDHDGNSGTVRRIQLVSRLLKALPASRWKGLVADREFIGGEWFRFLRRKGIKRAIRIRKNAVVDELRVDTWFGDLQVGEVRCLAEKAYVYGEVMQVVATRSPAGDLVAIATDFSVWDTCVLYRARWSIECTFASLKIRGFDLERTGITQPDRFERLFGLVILAWVSCLRVGVWCQTQLPIKVKAHGRAAMSLVRYGAEQLCHALRWNLPELPELVRLLSTPFHASGAA